MSSNHFLSSMIECLEEEMATDMAAEIDSLRVNIAMVDGQIAIQKANIASIDEQLGDLSEVMAKLKPYVNGLVEDVNKIQETLPEYRRFVAKADDAINKRLREIVAVKNTIKSKRASNDKTDRAKELRQEIAKRKELMEKCGYGKPDDLAFDLLKAREKFAKLQAKKDARSAKRSSTS